jgi:hypothetical protein
MAERIPKYEKYVGETFNNLVFLEILQEKHPKLKQYLGRFKCLLCKREDYKTLPSYVVGSKVKSCGCNKSYYQKTGSDNKGYTGYEEISGNRWCQNRLRAEKYNREFSVTIEEAWEIFLLQNRKCAISGQLIYFGKTNSEKPTASLDRIDSSLGYTRTNVQWVHKDVNIMKNDKSQNDFIDICKLITEFQYGKTINKD